MKRVVAIIMVVFCIMSFAFANGATESKAVAVDKQAGGIVRGGTLVSAITTKCSNLNPTKTSSRADDRYLLGQIYEPLIGIDESGNFIPWLATSWQMSDTKLTLTLRDDVVFHDGTKFNAQAVKKVLEWYLSPECKHIYRSEISDIASIEVVDEYTVQLNLSAPNASLIGALSNVAGYMISPAAIEKYGSDLSLYTCGTGPFILKEAIEGDHYTLVRNENYYLKGEDGKALPYLDEIVIRIIGDDSVKTTNLQTGDIDLVDWDNSFSSTLTLQNDPNMETKVTAATDFYVFWINTADAQLKDLRVRQALAYSLDRGEIVVAMTEGLGSTGLFLATEKQWFFSDYNPYSYNPEKAKALLAEAGYADGITITMRYISREPDNTVAQLVQAQMKKCGINLKIEAMDKVAWVDLHSTKNGGELGFAKCAAPRVDPYQQYAQMTNYITKNAESFEQYGKRLIELLENSKKTFDIDARKAYLAEFQKVDLDNCENIFLYSKPRYTTWNNRVKGVQLETDGTWNLKAAWLSE